MKFTLLILFLSIFDMAYSFFQVTRTNSNLALLSNSKTIRAKPASFFPTSSILKATTEDVNDQQLTGLSAWLSPSTRGGVITWSVILTAIPYGIYNILVSTGLDESKVGAYVGSIFVLLSCLLWASTYIFRVATKDMTYAQQLRDYENAVLQKRLEELADDEIQALMEEIEVEDSKKDSPPSEVA